MNQSLKSITRSRLRRNFGKIKSVASIPNLIELQKNSYNFGFLQLDNPSSERDFAGLQSVFLSVFPIEDESKTAHLDFVSYNFDKPKYDVEECLQRGGTYSASLRATLRLTVWEVDEENDTREIKGIKEQEVYMGEVPLMTKSGTFVINGTERVIVSQMHRSPGVFFYHDEGKTHSSGKFLYSARIIPYRGSWLDFEFDVKDVIYFRIDRKRKLPVTTLLFAIGMNVHDILNYYYDKQHVTYDKKLKQWVTEFDISDIRMHRLEHDLINAENGEIILQKGQKITPRLARKYAENGLNKIVVNDKFICDSYLASEVIDEQTGEVLADTGALIDVELLTKILDSGVKNLSLLKIESGSGAYLRNTLFLDKNKDRESALIDIFKVLRPGEPPAPDAGEEIFKSLFFDNDKYDLLEVGRVKMNSSLNQEIDLSNRCLVNEDIKQIVKKLINIRNGRGSIDDIDHLGNRRVRPVGELVENQVRIAFVKMEKNIKERMASVDVDTVMPYDLINSKMLGTSLKEFFGTSQLSQFMDQTNPLSEVGHKRKLSALGPGGVSRDRVGFEVRDVHSTHYGRICPVETPEGQNVGLINSMATYARVNKYGFIESPYRKVENGVVTNDVVYLSANDEERYTIAQSDINIDDDGKILDEYVTCRVVDGNFQTVVPSEVDYIDVTPKQVVSVAASLIPFLENDDANRALMGSNMQRQAVPLMNTDAPFVGTGMESVVARDSGSAIVALHDGVVEEVDSNRIVVSALEGQKTDGSADVDIYRLSKFQRSNHNTCINQKPLVNVGDYVKKGDVIADGAAMERGEIALGRNILVAFASWRGYNFEDSILVSERIVKDDIFTSVHIEAFEVVARDTRIGPEVITRDIPNIHEDNLSHLDETGIVRIGADISPGDILVGKVTPKSESPVTPEEKLLRAIFGEKAADVKDSSLYTPPGINGTVTEVRVFSRRGVEKDERALAIEKKQIEKLSKDKEDEISIIDHFVFFKLKKIFEGQKIVSDVGDIKAGDVITSAMLDKISKKQYWDIVVDDSDIMSDIEQIKLKYDDRIANINDNFHDKVEKIQAGDDLPQGALKVIKIFVATKLKLQPGDKMAGRHGNKGVVSRIMPEEDMPFLEDGTPVDLVLNPLGVPSRMNVGQILETHLGFAAKSLGKKIGNMLVKHDANEIELAEIKEFVCNIYKNKETSDIVNSMDDKDFIALCHDMKKGVYFSTPVFDGAKVEHVKEMLELADQDPSGQMKLIDGRTGEYFDRAVTVGYKYLLKLHHLVDNKMHARSVGPYSLVTQQPLGGKSHFGGQRFGEMECWALQAYGAAYSLQEMLTVKSDDVSGRVRMYESIVKGNGNFESGIPESFNVMIKELRSLCLNIQLMDSGNDNNTEENKESDVQNI